MLSHIFSSHWRCSQCIYVLLTNTAQKCFFPFALLEWYNHEQGLLVWSQGNRAAGMDAVDFGLTNMCSVPFRLTNGAVIWTWWFLTFWDHQTQSSYYDAGLVKDILYSYEKSSWCCVWWCILWCSGTWLWSLEPPGKTKDIRKGATQVNRRHCVGRG